MSSPSFHRQPLIRPDVPDHELIRRIGRGSYGEVWLARNVHGRYRAAKTVRRRDFDNDRPFDREFAGIRRFEPISRSHEGFVDILQVGMARDESFFYYVMELGDDQTAGQEINPETYVPRTLASDVKNRKRLPAQWCLEYGIALSKALAELERLKLVHRDIKPSNIIFVNGIPKLADIGLVSEAGANVSFVGTEGFFPPEGPSAPTTDVYALGKLLYEAATGKDRLDFPQLPLEWEGSPEQAALLELNEVILRACHSDPKRRYASALDMHADLVLALNGRSLRRLRALERRWTTMKRGIGFGALGLVAAGMVLYPSIEGRRLAAETRERRIGADVSEGTRAMMDGDLQGALFPLMDALTLDSGNQGRQAQHRLRLGSILAQCPKPIQLWAVPNDVTHAEFSRDGRQALVIERGWEAWVREVETGAVIARLGRTNGPRNGGFSPDGTLVVGATGFTNAVVWSVKGDTPPREIPHTNGLTFARFSPDGRRIATGCENGDAWLWDAQTGTCVQPLLGHSNSILHLAFSPDQRLIATCAMDFHVRVWDSSGCIKDLPHPLWAEYVAFSPDGRVMATACEDHLVRFFDTTNWQQILPVLRHRDVVFAVEYSPDGHMLATAGSDRAVRLWDADSHSPLVPNHAIRLPDRVRRASFSPDGHRLLIACSDGTTWVWDLARRTPEWLGAVQDASEDLTRYLTVERDGFRVWDCLSNSPVSPTVRAGLPAARIGLDFSGRFVLTSRPVPGGGAQVSVWEADTGNLKGDPWPIHTLGLTNAVMSPDGTHLVLLTETNAQVGDLATHQLLPFVVSHSNSIRLAVFAPDGQFVATGARDRVKVWAVGTGAARFPELEQPPQVEYVAFDAAGRRLITCGRDDSLNACYAQVWDAVTGRPVGGRLHHEDGIIKAAFDPGRRWVATASEDYTAAIWDIVSGKRLASNLAHDHQVCAAAFNQDGQMLATVSFDQTLRLWDSQTGVPLSQPVAVPRMPKRVTFLADGIHLALSTGNRSNLWKWQLPLETRPAPELQRLVEFLSAKIEFPPSMSRADRATALLARWRELRSAYPADFTASAEEAALWHEFQATVAERATNFSRAVFHLEKLQELHTEHKQVPERLARARAGLERAKTEGR